MVAVGFAIRIPHPSRRALACDGVLPHAPDLQEEVVKTEKFRGHATVLNSTHGRIRFGNLVPWDDTDVNKTHDRLETINTPNLVPKGFGK